MTNCPICVNGHEPSQHSCIICSKFVHLHEQCSKSVDGEEEGSSEKRICLECDHRNVEIFTANCFESEKTAVVEKNEKQTVQQDDDKQSLKNFFHYEKVEDMKHGFCLICGKDESGNYKTKIPMKASNTTGLKSHLQRHHRKQYEKLFPLETSRKKSSNTKLQSTLDRFSIVSENKCTTERRIVTWVCFKNLPKSFFDDRETQNFFAFFNKNIPVPSKNQANIMIKEEFKKMQKNVKNLLEKNKSKFAFTIDAWSGKTRKSYYGVTVHYIDKNWTLNSFAIDFSPSKGKHSGLDIAHTFYEIAKFYNIHDKIAGITVDNAAANIKFTSELSKILKNDKIDFDPDDQHFRCLAHVLNLSVQDILKLMEVECYDGENCSDEEEEEEEEEEEKEEEVDDDDDLDNIPDYEIEDFESKQKFISNVVNKIRKLLKKIRNSEKISLRLEACCKVFDIKYKVPLSDSKTRWNSTFDMLNNAYQMKDALDQLCKTYDTLTCVEPSEWILVGRLLEFLGDYKRVSERISGEKYVTLPGAVIAFNCLLDRLEKKSFELDEQEHLNEIDRILILAFQKGRDKLINHYQKCNWIYCISLILDPRSKAIGLQKTGWSRELHDETLDKFKSVFKIYYDKYFIDDCTEEPALKKCRKSEEDLDFDILFVKPKKSIVWMNEINKYLEDPRPDSDTDILLWWKLHANEYPIIARMARDILCIPATSVPAERLFSEASLVLTKTRCSLKDDSLRELICINRWMRSNNREEICEIK
ncbi:hypothetical protein TKK_0004629 [Trichogramma kaykai]|uniref:HAT C-terminal dimerisation domain-containing protein n=1 Tax=Trichogramma kaykai TaxID=54128 RepID=A0ABD2XNE1_9HYME